LHSCKKENFDDFFYQEKTTDINLSNVGGGGTPQNFQCPPGQALKGYTIHAGAWVDGLDLECRNVLDDGNPTKSPHYGGYVGKPQKRNCYTNVFLSGMAGRGGQYLDQLTGRCTDAIPYIKTAKEVSKQLDCCAGTVVDPFACGKWIPGSPACLEAKRSACSQRKYFFTEPCKQIFAPTARQVKNQSDNDLAQKICTQVKHDPNATEEEKDWCSCYNAEVPPDTPLVARGIFQCIDPKCKSKGLLPFGMMCPSSLVLCTQKEFTTELSKSNIGRQYIANECGGIKIETGPGRAPPPPLPTKMNPYLIGGLAIGVMFNLCAYFLSQVIV